MGNSPIGCAFSPANQKAEDRRNTMDIPHRRIIRKFQLFPTYCGIRLVGKEVKLEVFQKLRVNAHELRVIDALFGRRSVAK